MALTLTTEALVRDLDTLPAQQAVAVRVLHISSDQRTSATDLAAAVMADPAITAQVIRLANSAYYGLSGRVRSVPFAVTVVGFVSIRSVVAAFAAGALGQEADVPDGFWNRAAAHAAAASLVAPRVEASRPSAFSLGLLHELGDFLLYRSSPEAHAEVLDAAPSWDCARRARVERALFGLDHSEALSRCLEAWLFPEELVEAVALHASATRASTPLTRCLAGACALGPATALADDQRAAGVALLGKLARPLDAAGIEPSLAWGLSRQARAEASTLAASFIVQGEAGKM